VGNSPSHLTHLHLQAGTTRRRVHSRPRSGRHTRDSLDDDGDDAGPGQPGLGWRARQACVARAYLPAPAHHIPTHPRTRACPARELCAVLRCACHTTSAISWSPQRPLLASALPTRVWTSHSTDRRTGSPSLAVFPISLHRIHHHPFHCKLATRHRACELLLLLLSSVLPEQPLSERHTTTVGQ